MYTSLLWLILIVSDYAEEEQIRKVALRQPWAWNVSNFYS